MRLYGSVILAGVIIIMMLVAGCADVSAKQKVGDFGTAFGATADEQKAIDWFKATYGDPTMNNDKPARFVEPLVTTGLSDKNLPVDKVTTFPVSGGSVYFFVIYDNFKKGDPITVSWTYLENGKEVTTVKQEAGGDFGRFIVEFQKPDSGWGKGKQRITVSGDGATATVDFAIGDTLGTVPLPYNPAAGSGTASGSTGQTTNNPPSGAPTCAAGSILCNDRCAYLKNDRDNCGSCGNKCPSGNYCKDSQCCYTDRVPGGLGWDVTKEFCKSTPTSVYTEVRPTTIITTMTLSPDVDKKLLSDTKSKAVPDSKGALMSQQGLCPYGQSDCNGKCIDLKNDPFNCGSCDNKCSLDHAAYYCKNGQCTIGNCIPLYADCDKNPANGCEVDTYDDPDNCGSCGIKCSEGQKCGNTYPPDTGFIHIGCI
jgi:hypothetical protein